MRDTAGAYLLMCVGVALFGLAVFLQTTPWGDFIGIGWPFRAFMALVGVCMIFYGADKVKDRPET